MIDEKNMEVVEVGEGDEVEVVVSMKIEKKRFKKERGPGPLK